MNSECTVSECHEHIHPQVDDHKAGRTVVIPDEGPTSLGCLCLKQSEGLPATEVYTFGCAFDSPRWRLSNLLFSFRQMACVSCPSISCGIHRLVE